MFFFVARFTSQPPTTGHERTAAAATLVMGVSIAAATFALVLREVLDVIEKVSVVDEAELSDLGQFVSRFSWHAYLD